MASIIWLPSGASLDVGMGVTSVDCSAREFTDELMLALGRWGLDVDRLSSCPKSSTSKGAFGSVADTWLVAIQEDNVCMKCNVSKLDTEICDIKVQAYNKEEIRYNKNC